MEVVAGLTLLASLVVGILLSYRLHHRQLQTAEVRLAAIDLADKLLAQWHAQPDGVPLRAQGPLAAPGWFWQTQPVSRRRVAGLIVDVVRLDIMALRPADETPLIGCSVEVIRPTSTLAGAIR